MWQLPLPPESTEQGAGSRWKITITILNHSQPQFDLLTTTEHLVALSIEIFMIKPRPYFRVVRVTVDISPMLVNLRFFFPLYVTLHLPTLNFTSYFPASSLRAAGSFCNSRQLSSLLLQMIQSHQQRYVRMEPKQKPQWNLWIRAKLGCPVLILGPTWGHPVPCKDSSYPKIISKWSVSKKGQGLFLAELTFWKLAINRLGFSQMCWLAEII